jgi:hypothetical protein
MRPLLENSDIQCFTLPALIHLIIAQILWIEHMDCENSMHISRRCVNVSRMTWSSMTDTEEMVGITGFNHGMVLIDVESQNFSIFL